jgi:hypothetical protein
MLAPWFTVRQKKTAGSGKFTFASDSVTGGARVARTVRVIVDGLATVSSWVRPRKNLAVGKPQRTQHMTP